MVTYTFRVFGIPVFTLERIQFALEDEDESPAVGGGSAHNFERDFDPLSPTSHHEWEWEDKKKGFGFG